MKKKVTVAVLAAIILAAVVAPAADAKKSQSQRIKTLEKTVKRQSRQIVALSSMLNATAATANDAAGGVAVIASCILVAPVGTENVLTDTTDASFIQGTPDGSIPDVFSWMPSANIGLMLGGPDWMMIADPSCVNTSGALRGKHFKQTRLR